MSDLVEDLRTVFFENEDELGRLAADEIERLREERNGLEAQREEAIGAVKEVLGELRTANERIEELEDECAQLKQGYTAIRNDMSRLSRESGERIKDLQTELAVCDGREAVLCTRIEELESYKQGVDLVLSEVYHITDEQINAAWALMEKYSSSGIPIRAQAIREALAELGIERCGICDRSPGKQYEWGKGDELQPCTNCSGHGWVKK